MVRKITRNTAFALTAIAFAGATQAGTVIESFESVWLDTDVNPAHAITVDPASIIPANVTQIKVTYRVEWRGDISFYNPFQQKATVAGEHDILFVKLTDDGDDKVTLVDNFAGGPVMINPDPAPACRVGPTSAPTA